MVRIPLKGIGVTVLVTADLMGDPTPEQRRRRAEVTPLIEANELHTLEYQRAYAAGYRARSVINGRPGAKTHDDSLFAKRLDRRVD